MLYGRCDFLRAGCLQIGRGGKFALTRRLDEKLTGTHVQIQAAGEKSTGLGLNDCNVFIGQYFFDSFHGSAPNIQIQILLAQGAYQGATGQAGRQAFAMGAGGQ